MPNRVQSTFRRGPRPPHEQLGIETDSLLRCYREPKVLTGTPRGLTPTTPTQVDHALTTMGREVLGPVRALAGWALNQTERIAEARRRYDAPTP